MTPHEEAQREVTRLQNELLEAEHYLASLEAR